MLPRALRGRSIRCEEPETVYDPSALVADRMAALISLGWSDGQLPASKALKMNMLERVEFEYAEHVHLHGLFSGDWCDECRCICAYAVDPALATLFERDYRRAPISSSGSDYDDDDQLVDVEEASAVDGF